MKLQGYEGSVEAKTGDRFVDSSGMEWEIVEQVGAGMYSPTGIGGTAVVACRHISGDVTNMWTPHLVEGVGEWCGDSLASEIIRHRRSQCSGKGT